MSDESRERKNVLVDVFAFGVPALQSAANKVMPKVVNARRRMSAAGSPPQRSPQTIECITNVPCPERSTSVINEEGITAMAEWFAIPVLHVVSQRLCRGWMQWNPAVF